MGVDTVDGELIHIARQMTHRLIDSRSSHTNTKYFSSFRKWKEWATEKNVEPLPANPIFVALYITKLIEEKRSVSVVNSAVYAIKWAHELSGYESPTTHPFIKNLMESTKRSFGKPVQRKEPVTPEMLLSLCSKYKDTSDITAIRDIAMITLAFSAFLRYDELSKLKCNQVHFYDEHVTLNIEFSKTDQYRKGNEIVLAKLPSVACPYVNLHRYISVCNIDLHSDFYLFQPLVCTNNIVKCISKNKPLSYTRARETLINRLKEVVNTDMNIGLHSLRSGGATAAANANVSDRCFKLHGRWKSETAKDGYVDDSLESRLFVSQNLGL